MSPVVQLSRSVVTHGHQARREAGDGHASCRRSAGPRPTEGEVWLRTSGHHLDGVIERKIALAFLSDCASIETATRQHALSGVNPQTQLASIDHHIWFHRDAIPCNG